MAQLVRTLSCKPELKNVIKKQSEMKNRITELNNSIEGFNRINEAEMISELKNGVVEFIQATSKKEKRMEETKDTLRD